MGKADTLTPDFSGTATQRESRVAGFGVVAAVNFTLSSEVNRRWTSASDGAARLNPTAYPRTTVKTNDW